MPYLLHHPKIPLLWIQSQFSVKGFWDDGVGMACDASFRSSQTVFLMKVTVVRVVMIDM